MAQLHDEIVESQKVRSDLLKWKIILVAALGGTGFGITGGTNSTKYADLVLCCIPFVCVYIDMLCRHLSLRIYAIGYFRKNWKAGESGEDKDYETFTDTIRNKHAFALESAAVVLSSAAFCLSLAFLPRILKSVRTDRVFPNKNVITWCGIIGFILVLIVEGIYWLLRSKINKTPVTKTPNVS